MQLVWEVTDKSQNAIIISYMFISYFFPDYFLEKGAYYACLWCAIAQILNGDICFLLSYIISNKMKYQITEKIMMKIYFSGKMSSSPAEYGRILGGPGTLF